MFVVVESTSASESWYETPYKYGSLVLAKSAVKGSFDSQGVDGAFVFSVGGKLYMTYIGFDGVGYQTGLATSDDLVHWTKEGIILARDPNSKYTKTSIAMTCILRESGLNSQGSLMKVGGRYVGVWHAYPGAGYEVGPALTGLAWSTDLKHWEIGEPILRPDDGASWERGGLYKSFLTKEADTYYLFYNAKDSTEWPWHEQIGVATSKDLKAWVRYPWNPILRNGGKGAWDERFASDPFVVRRGATWAMYYFGLSEGDFKARELLALGSDPYHFTKVSEILIDVGPPGSLDDRFAHKPAVISWKGDLYHFYTAASGRGSGEAGDVRGITVARSRPW
jgi:predicted GH43/DUF377 family glycosyl hydrolase